MLVSDHMGKANEDEYIDLKELKSHSCLQFSTIFQWDFVICITEPL